MHRKVSPGVSSPQHPGHFVITSVGPQSTIKAKDLRFVSFLDSPVGSAARPGARAGKVQTALGAGPGDQNGVLC